MIDLLRSRTVWNEWREKTHYEPITIERIRFDDDDLSDYHFMYCHFRGCNFRRTLLHETNFRDASFEHCDFTDAKFWKTKFEDCDLRTCRFNDVPVNCFVEGAIISPRHHALIQAFARKLKVQEVNSGLLNAS